MDSPLTPQLEELSRKIADYQQRVEAIRLELDLVHLRSPDLETARDPAAVISFYQTFRQRVEEVLEEMETSLSELMQQQDMLIEAQTALMAERQRYEDLFHRSPLALVITDVYGKIVESNREAQRLMGLTSNFRAGQVLVSQFLKPHHKPMRRRLNQLQRGETVEPWEAELMRPTDRALIPVRLTVSVLRLDETPRLFWLVQDITREQEATAYLENRGSVLEQMAKQRTEALMKLNAKFFDSAQKNRQRADALQRQLDQEHLLETVAQKIRESLDLEAVLTTAVTEIRQFLEVERAIVFRLKPNGQGVITAQSATAACQPILHSTFDDPCFRDGSLDFSRQQPYRAIDDINAADLLDCHRQLLQELQVQAILSMPLWHENSLWGLLILHHCSAAHAWDEHEIQLMQRLATQVAIAIKQSELHAQVQRLATTDALTQVANRYRLEAYLEETWNRLAREGRPLTLVLCDIDEFKHYNDTYGHPEGDGCLRQVAALLAAALKRPADLVARYGGEEFALVLPNTHRAGAEALIQMMQQDLKTAAIAHDQVATGYLTLSFGMATVIPTPDGNPAELVKAADDALYQAKRAGRNGWWAIELTAAGVDAAE